MSKSLWCDSKKSGWEPSLLIILCHLQKSKSITLSSKCNGPGKCIGYFGS